MDESKNSELKHQQTQPDQEKDREISKAARACAGAIGVSVTAAGMTATRAIGLGGGPDPIWGGLGLLTAVKSQETMQDAIDFLKAVPPNERARSVREKAWEKIKGAGRSFASTLNRNRPVLEIRKVKTIQEEKDRKTEMEDLKEAFEDIAQKYAYEQVLYDTLRWRTNPENVGIVSFLAENKRKINYYKDLSRKGREADIKADKKLDKSAFEFYAAVMYDYIDLSKPMSNELLNPLYGQTLGDVLKKNDRIYQQIKRASADSRINPLNEHIRTQAGRDYFNQKSQQWNEFERETRKYHGEEIDDEKDKLKTA